MTKHVSKFSILAATAGAVTVASPAIAQDNSLSSGDTAWMLTSTVIVLMMTIPGVALFYGGMVRKKNVLSTIMHSFAATLIDYRYLVDRWLQLDLHRRDELCRWSQQTIPRRPDCAGHERVDSGIRIHDIPNDIRDHHSCPYLGRDRGTHEIFRPALVSRLVVHSRVFAHLLLGMGWRLPW